MAPSATTVYDPSLVKEQSLKLGTHGEFRLVEFTRSRTRKWKSAMDAMERHGATEAALEKLDNGDDLTEDDVKTLERAELSLELAGDELTAAIDTTELATVREIGHAIEAATQDSDGIAEKLLADYEADRISDGFLARSLQSVIEWEAAQQQAGNA